MQKKKNNTVEFRYWRSQVKMLSVRSKTDFFNQEINSNLKNPKTLWRNLTDLSGKNRKHSNQL